MITHDVIIMMNNDDNRFLEIRHFKSGSTNFGAAKIYKFIIVISARAKMADDGGKADLRELSQCLSQASSLINTILKQPDNRSSSSQSTTPERTPPLIQNERQQFGNNTYDMNNQFPRHRHSTDEGVNRPSSGEASTSQHVSVVSSAINRARLMIQQSSSKGLYSRLGKRERLRATKPADTKSKKPRVVNEKPKVFEFVLLQTEESDNKGIIVFEENMVALRGFIEISKDANEKVIRSKLGEAIRIKFPMVSDSDFEFVRANRRRLTKPVSVGEYNFNQIKLLAGQGCIYLKMRDGLDCVLVEDVLDEEFDFEKEGMQDYK